MQWGEVSFTQRRSGRLMMLLDGDALRVIVTV
jgi:hypothetical protein